MTTKKLDIRSFICEHRHRVFTCKDGGDACSHLGCWEKARLKDMKVLYLDIEVSQLAANFGICIAWCAKERDKNIYYQEAINEADVAESKRLGKVVTDRRILKILSEVLPKYDVIVCHYGTIQRGLDVRFLRTRFIKYGIKFPVYKQMFGLDTYLLAKYKLALHSNRLDVIAKFLGAPTQKTEIEPDDWILAGYGLSKSIRYVKQHNKIDVDVLEFVHRKLEPFGNLGQVSI